MADTRHISYPPPESGRNLLYPYMPGTRSFTERVNAIQLPNPLTTPPGQNSLLMGAVGVVSPISAKRVKYLDSLVDKVKSLKDLGRIPAGELSTTEQQYLVNRGIVFDVDRMGKAHIGYSRERRVQDLREKVMNNAANRSK